jgi:hypothetical protein
MRLATAAALVVGVAAHIARSHAESLTTACEPVCGSWLYAYPLSRFGSGDEVYDEGKVAEYTEYVAEAGRGCKYGHTEVRAE